ncbi:class C beta-lactamase-related serine hydrolase [Flexivirga caeni]|uniref:Class C beta-lactamase-related serine hydrolase n=1 Tax=Flexivirga caeni TaxID=2294115 RepID=A0A3M9MGU5_9MICO|nr:class C beta-lactamase-related serine hydrolase [Flexivirga caeni]
MQPDPDVVRRVSDTSIPALIVGISDGESRTILTGGTVSPSASSAFRIASLTKPFTAAATVLALATRSIPLETPAIELLPALEPDWRADRAVTVGQLLGQVAGLRETVTGAAVASLGAGRAALLEAARMVVRAGNERAVGARWSYYNGNYFLAGAILSEVTGQPPAARPDPHGPNAFRRSHALWPRVGDRPFRTALPERQAPGLPHGHPPCPPACVRLYGARRQHERAAGDRPAAQ